MLGADITVTGEPVLGGTVTWDVISTGPAALIFGRPMSVPLDPICPGCTLGVDRFLDVGDPLVLRIPCDAAILGVTFSVQGMRPCLGLASFTDTVDTTCF